MTGRMRRPATLAAAASLLVAAIAIALLARAPEAGAVGTLGKQPIGTFDSPVYVTGSPTGGLFVVEQPGTIRVLRNGHLRSRPFLNIRSIVNSGGEQGLLSVVFPPNYRQTRRFYVYFTDKHCNGDNCDNEIDEFRRSPSDRNRALASTRRKVLEINHKDFNDTGASNHNGGQLQFGPGGYLFAGTGDGGSGGDPPNNALNKHVLLGKLLRIEPRPHRGRPYGVPASNPYVGRDGRDEIFSIGLRNPWRYSFDRKPGRAARIAIGDVGQDLYEEVDYERVSTANGGDFGWSRFEGFHDYDTSRHAPAPRLAPIFEYSHGVNDSNGCAITGGYVVRNSNLPSLEGRYIYADLCDGEIHSFVPDLSGAGPDTGSGLTVGQPTSFGVDRGHHYYVASLGGPVYRIVEN